MGRHSNDERTTVLEKASSRDVFEKASSMSAKLTKSSSELDRKNEFIKFPFDSVLLESKVYRRVCESSWIREVSTALKDGNELNGSGPSSVMSVSSNSAIASEGDCESSSEDFGISGRALSDVLKPKTPEPLDYTYSSRCPPTLELSASNSSEQTGESSSSNPTKSTLATTLSSIDGTSVGRDIGIDDKGNHMDKSSTHVISVAVEEVGADSTELASHEASDHYDKVQEAVLHIRDRVLLAGGVDPGSYCGVCISSTIETTGQSEVHRFPLTPDFLAYAANKVRDGYYDSFEILARFSSPTRSKGTDLGCPCSTTSGSAAKSIMKSEPTKLAQMLSNAGDEPRHFVIPSQDTLPFIESSEPEYRVKGGFSDVCRVKIHPAYLDGSAGCREGQFFAVKRFRHSDTAATMFRKEVRALKAIFSSGHPHLIQLLATYHWGGFDHLVFPWAEGNLQDFWKSHPTSPSIQSLEEDSSSVARWFSQQCLGLAEALNHIHLSLNPARDIAVGEQRTLINYGRHGDLKPENILWFNTHDGNEGRGILVISDLGLAAFNSPKSDGIGPGTRGGTETYSAPELKHHHPGHHLSAAYDVWSLACVLLEFASWYLRGWEEVDGFKRSRSAKPRSYS